MNKGLTIRIARANAFSIDSITSVCKLVNDAYKTGEAGMWVDDLPRTSVDELSDRVRSNQLIIAELKGGIVGTVCVRQLADGHTGEFGMLAVDGKYSNNGIGAALIRQAEAWAISKELIIMRLELLTPRHWEHPAKEILKKWYSKLGYQPQESISFYELYPAAATYLATECDFRVWTKRLEGFTP